MAQLAVISRFQSPSVCEGKVDPMARPSRQIRISEPDAAKSDTLYDSPASHPKQQNQRQARKLLRRKRHLFLLARDTADGESKTDCLPTRHQDTAAEKLAQTSSAESMATSSQRQYQPSDAASVASSAAASALSSKSSTTPPTTTARASSSSAGSGGGGDDGASSSQATNRAEENCHFAFSAELRMVDRLVSILAQNRQGGEGANPGQPRTS